MRDAFTDGFKAGLQQWRIAAIVYFFQLCLALTLGMQVFNVLEASIGNSLEINKLIKDYDHTVLTDFLKVHGASITPLVGQLRWLVLVYGLFAVFIDAGLLYCAASPQPAKAQSFWRGGALHFFPFLKIGLLFLFLSVVWTGVIWAPFLAFFEPSLQFFSSEVYTVWLALLLLLVYLVGLAVLFTWSVLSRLVYMERGSRIASCLKQGWQIFRKNKKRLLGLLFGFALLQAALFAIYLLLEAATGMTSPFLIAVFFMVQQAFVFFRIQIRQMVYVGIARQVDANVKFVLQGHNDH